MIDGLITQFSDIMKTIDVIDGKFELLGDMVVGLSAEYTAAVKKHEDTIFTMGLDVIQFQSRLVSIEFDDIIRLKKIIFNQMYSDYYKLYKRICEALHKPGEFNLFPIYLDLEPFKQYGNETLVSIHTYIIDMLRTDKECIDKKNNDIVQYKTKMEEGVGGLDNLMTTLKFTIHMDEEQNALLTNYVQSCHRMHAKYLTRLLAKINLMFSVLNE
jgi:hypothetical protein